MLAQIEEVQNKNEKQGIYIYGVDVVEWSRALDVRLSDGAAVYQWCELKSRPGKKKNLTAQKSNSNTGLIFRCVYIYI